MIWLVCGGRNFLDTTVVERTLNEMRVFAPENVTHLINGLAVGVDTIARAWAIRLGIQPVDCPALWGTYPRRGDNNAGTRRNTAMLNLEPHWVIAFPGGSGTLDMVSQTKGAMRFGVQRPSKLFLVNINGLYNEWTP